MSDWYSYGISISNVIICSLFLLLSIRSTIRLLINESAAFDYAASSSYLLLYLFFWGKISWKFMQWSSSVADFAFVTFFSTSFFDVGVFVDFGSICQVDDENGKEEKKNCGAIRIEKIFHFTGSMVFVEPPKN